MGNAVGVPTDEINAVAKEVMTTFTPMYLKHFGVALIEQMKAKRAATPSPYLLLEEPTPSDVRLSGYLTKQGGVNKNWKKRWFVALNAADNYAVNYYVDEAAAGAGAKPKGTIHLCWYRVERLTSDDEKKMYGEFSAALRPWSSWDRRRTWYLRAESEEDIKKWAAVLEYAARRASPPLNPDPVLSAAFRGAYEATRWRLGEWGWYYYARTEADQLAQLVVDRCERTCMQPVYSKLPSGRMESVLREKVQGILDTTVGAAVGAGWKAASSAIEDQKPKVEALAEKSLGVVLDKQAELQGKISDAILGQLRPGIEKLASPVLGPITKTALKPMAAAYSALAGIVAKELGKVAAARSGKAGEAADKAEAAALAEFKSDTYWTWASCLWPAFAAVRNLTQYKAGAATAGVVSVEINLEDIVRLLDGLNLWEIEDRWESGIRTLARNAAYTYSAEVKENPAAPRDAVVSSVVSKLLADCKTRAGEDLVWMFTRVIAPPITKNLLPPVQGALEPIKALIPEALSTLMDVDAMVEDILDTVLTGLITAHTDPAVGTAMAVLDGLGLGAPASGGAASPVKAKPSIMSEHAGEADALGSPIAVGVRAQAASPTPVKQ